MKEKKNKKIIDKDKIYASDWFRIVLLIIGSAFTTLVLTFSILSILEVKPESVGKAPLYLAWVFIFLGCTRFISFFKNRSKSSLIRSIVLSIVDLGLGILVIFAKYDLYIFSIAGGLYGISIIVSRIFKLIERHRVRDFIYNGLLMTAALCLAIGLFLTYERGMMPAVILIECLIIAITAFIEVAVMAFGQLKMKVLFKIIVKTYALEILLGLLTMIVSFSLILMLYEPSMSYYPDALWYCFAVVTTIGFGDINAVTHVGRAVSVILGVYGIIVVAVITSIIVNFYNETKGKEDAKQIDEIKKDEEEKHKK